MALTQVAQERRDFLPLSLAVFSLISLVIPYRQSLRNSLSTLTHYLVSSAYIMFHLHTLCFICVQVQSFGGGSQNPNKILDNNMICNQRLFSKKLKETAENPLLNKKKYKSPKQMWSNVSIPSIVHFSGTNYLV